MLTSDAIFQLAGFSLDPIDVPGLPPGARAYWLDVTPTCERHRGLSADRCPVIDDLTGYRCTGHRAHPAHLAHYAESDDKQFGVSWNTPSAPSAVPLATAGSTTTSASAATAAAAGPSLHLPS